MIEMVSRVLRSTAYSAIAMVAISSAVAQEQSVTMWSHWPDELAKRNYVEARVKEFEGANPSCKVKLQFIQKSEIYTAAKTAVRTGTAPDIFWLEPDEIGFAKNGFLEPLDKYVNLNNVEDWAKASWTYNGKIYGLPLEAYTVELYYNRELVKKVGIDVPANAQLSQDQFTDLVKKGTAAGITPIAQGVGDRPYPGAYLLQEALLHRLGMEDYKKLVTSKLSFKDPRVIEMMTWVKQLIDSGAYPKSFATLKLGESHYYFHTNPGALTFPIGSWYTGRAFVSPDKGGQPKNFPLGIMRFPAVKGGVCNECKTLAVGGSYVLYSKSKSKDCAGKLLGSFTTIENGNKWMEAVLLQTGIKTDPSRIQSIYAPYFKELQARSQNAKFFIGTPLHHMTGKCSEAYSQVLNRAFAGGLITANEAAAQMDAACGTGS